MKVLAIESSAVAASIAVAEDNQLICEYTTNYKKTHSQTLMPMIEEVCNMINLDLDELDVIAVSKGPGSFTGLRIGVATAKGLAHTLEIPIAGINTLDALAYNIGYTDRIICPLMDARRNQVYTGLYSYNGNDFINILPSTVVPIEEIIIEIKKLSRQVIFLGDGVAPNIDAIKNNFTHEEYVLAPLNNNVQRASSVAALGILYGTKGKTESYMNFKPIYLRKSQAEREYERKHNTCI
ncbi:tRNA (adenosine(37)-N6)-threonylcarbamoyltransferase complex dimerization subunit type 1 TsaB [Vallitalea longa]|uniref:tRNA (Adenosine(37)-N6)-threonylcarbamoyltransferase complex dimerization subunit type 1 TsaB n=1 Tax=Vallitalea longa TaxID=2936439 RepID=A0A9W5YAQ1_9FIRM|nr:tRNA (adenosine(37)-N6)-threonylcarbamoyltransferase complex dimerization subunit type 1 TsaB [Vallitalea longa]GKX30487.1 tRNA (adenosine(37)-N6)-threonylcarbamoyltransferase complex dimerization subunit type 1 TsaB [Vallitalea longa]